MKFMKEALEQAKIAWHAGEVPVGCVLVDRASKTIIARSCNATNKTKNGTKHCEFLAIQQVIDQFGVSRLSDCILYVTVEPCVMCSAALRYAGIFECVFGCGNDRFGGCGSVYNFHKPAPGLNLPELKCRSGLLADKAIAVLKDFYAKGNPNAPDEKRARVLNVDGPLSV
eukprot:GDKJ01001442.1.p1 GENE.GDKJ01001442.1~~GDKJ01001442.1.p1  ORF type:complete len:191 (+),score=35.46 GDKJ01001442.1:64-573(+)